MRLFTRVLFDVSCILHQLGPTFYVVCPISIFNNYATVTHFRLAKMFIRYVKGTVNY